MPAADVDLRSDSPPTRLPFPPLTREHILRCSVHYWHPLFRSVTPKTRLIPLPPEFLSYLRSDGIVLPPELGGRPRRSSDYDESDGGYGDDDDDDDPSLEWADTHQAIRLTITELGGKVHPKLNWSAPKDATWIAATNSMECASPNDIYLLLKSSDFVTHDLEQAFDGCEDGEAETPVPYHLVLRKSISAIKTSMEFRCFVRDRTIVGICQRDLNHYEFLPSLIPTLQRLLAEFFREKLRDRFPETSYVFDAYIPQPEETGKVWLVDLNPWAQHTDPLLFSWLELLTMETDAGSVAAEVAEADEELGCQPEFRVVKRDDPEAYSFNTPLYSAHKLPRDVVDASLGGGGGIRDFIDNWEKIQEDARNGVSDNSEGE